MDLITGIIAIVALAVLAMVFAAMAVIANKRVTRFKMEKATERVAFQEEQKKLRVCERALAELGFKLEDATWVANRTWAGKELALARLQVIMKVARGEMDPELRETLPERNILG